jgi:hypothetical protein
MPRLDRVWVCSILCLSTKVCTKPIGFRFYEERWDSPVTAAPLLVVSLEAVS